MTEKKPSWISRWFGGIGVKKYLAALPFSVGILVVPLLPVAVIAYLLRQGQAPIVGALGLLLTFGYPLLLFKRPRAAWWVGTGVAVASLFGLLIAMVVVGFFFGFFLFLTLALAAAFVPLNWNKLRPWTFAVFAAVIVIHYIPMGFTRTAATLIGMGLMGLFFLLPERDRFPRAPIVVTLITAMLLSHGVSFYSDVGGSSDLKGNRAAREIYAYQSQRRGWARIVGTNPRFLTPSCDGREFFVGAKSSYRSGIVLVDPAEGKRRQIPIRGGVTENVVQDCRRTLMFVGSPGTNEIYAFNANDPGKPLFNEHLDGVRLGLLKLDLALDRLYVGSFNKDYLTILRAGNLADLDRVEFGSSVTDIQVDRGHANDVLVATMGGEIARVQARPIEKAASVEVGFGKVIYNLALDVEGRRLFVSSLFGRQIDVLNADTLETIASVPVRRGARYMQYDPDRDLLYVGNFFFGSLTAYRFTGSTLETDWSLDVGRRVRYLTLDRLRDQLCFSSQVGGYCLYLEMLHPKPPAPTPAPTPEPTPETEPESTPEEGTSPEA